MSTLHKDHRDVLLAETLTDETSAMGGAHGAGAVDLGLQASCARACRPKRVV